MFTISHRHLRGHWLNERHNLFIDLTLTNFDKAKEIVSLNDINYLEITKPDLLYA